jgi:predicted kinase
MRYLILFRGVPGCGKSTFIKENNLEQYALSADNIRLLCQSPILTIDGGYSVSQKNDKKVWQLLFDMMEQRMIRGEFIVVDATNSKTEEMNRYKNMAETYRYRIVCIDMTDVPIEICKQRNKTRLPEYKRVPDYILDNMYY